jgi:hypothetical protein
VYREQAISRVGHSRRALCWLYAVTEPPTFLPVRCPAPSDRRPSGMGFSGGLLLCCSVQIETAFVCGGMSTKYQLLYSALHGTAMRCAAEHQP